MELNNKPLSIKLYKEFEKETDCNIYDSSGKTIMQYVEWLEKRLKEAENILKFYAYYENWTDPYHNIIDYDLGAKARGYFKDKK